LFIIRGRPINILKCIPEEDGVVHTVDQVRGKKDNEEKLEKSQHLLQHHAEKAVFLVVPVHPGEKRVQVLHMVPPTFKIKPYIHLFLVCQFSIKLGVIKEGFKDSN